MFIQFFSKNKQGQQGWYAAEQVKYIGIYCREIFLDTPVSLYKFTHFARHNILAIILCNNFVR